MQRQLGDPGAAVRTVALLLGVLGITLGSVPPTYADAINCGAVLGPGGRFQLEQDLTCPGVRGAFTLRDGAVLDLNGHRVTCSNTTIGCVVLTGEGAQLRNGTVANALHELIVLEGTGGHTVRNVTSSPPIDGNIRITSDNNRLINVIARSGLSPAFSILGHNNRLTHSQAGCSIGIPSCIAISGDGNHLSDNIVSADSGFRGAGIDIAGHNNQLRRNHITNTSGPGIVVEETGNENHLSDNIVSVASGFFGGIDIAGHNNRLRRNHVTNTSGLGIVVEGTGNDLRFNLAHGMSFDLVDTNGDCTHNTWKHNIFETSNPPCIGAGRGLGALPVN